MSQFGRMVMALAMPLLGGALGSTIGVRNALIVGAAIAVLAFLWPYFSPLRWLRELPAISDDVPVPAG